MVPGEAGTLQEEGAGERTAEGRTDAQLPCHPATLSDEQISTTIARLAAMRSRQRADARPARVLPGLYVGSLGTARSARELRRARITHVINASPVVPCFFAGPSDDARYLERVLPGVPANVSEEVTPGVAHSSRIAPSSGPAVAPPLDPPAALDSALELSPRPRSPPMPLTKGAVDVSLRASLVTPEGSPLGSPSDAPGSHLARNRLARIEGGLAGGPPGDRTSWLAGDRLDASRVRPATIAADPLDARVDTPGPRRPSPSSAPTAPGPPAPAPVSTPHPQSSTSPAPAPPLRLEYLCVPLWDDPGADLLEHLPAVQRFADAARSQGGRVLIHCAAGRSRSVALAAAYLAVSAGVDPLQALEGVRQVRPQADPNGGFRRQLAALGRLVADGRAEEELGVRVWLAPAGASGRPKQCAAGGAAGQDDGPPRAPGCLDEAPSPWTGHDGTPHAWDGPAPPTTTLLVPGALGAAVSPKPLGAGLSATLFTGPARSAIQLPRDSYAAQLGAMVGDLEDVELA